MTIALTQHKFGHVDNGASIDVTFTGTPAVGSLIVVEFASNPSGRTYTVTDNQGNTYTLSNSSLFNGGLRGVFQYTATANTSSGTFTVSIASSPSSYMSVGISEWSGVLNETVDASAANSGTNAANLDSGTTGATTQADEVAIAAAAVDGNTNTITIAGGYSLIDEDHVGLVIDVNFSYLVLAATGTQQATWTSDAAGTWGALVTTFKAAGAVATPILDAGDDDVTSVIVADGYAINMRSVSDSVVSQAIDDGFTPPSGAKPVLERPDEDEGEGFPLFDPVPEMQRSAGYFGALLAAALSSEEWAPPSGATPVLERPDEDADAEEIQLWIGDPLAVADSVYATLKNAIDDAEVRPASGATPVLERPDEDEDGILGWITNDAARAQALSDQVLFQTLEDDHDFAPPSGAFPVLERPDDDEDQVLVWIADGVAGGADAAVQLAIDDSEVIPVDGTVAIVPDNPYEEDTPPLDTFDTSAWIALDLSIADAEVLPVSGAFPVLERADEDDDQIPVWADFATLAQASVDQSIFTTLEDDYDFAPPSGATPVLERADEDEDGIYLFPPLPANDDAVQLAIADAEVIPVSGALPVLEVPDPDDADVALWSQQADLPLVDEELLPVDGTVAVVADQPYDEAPDLEAVTVDYSATLLAIEDSEVIAVSGAFPVLEAPEPDDADVAFWPPAPDLPLVEEEVIPVDGAVIVVAADQPYDEPPDIETPALDYTALALAIADAEVIPTSGAFPVLEAPEPDDAEVVLWPLIDASVLVEEEVRPQSGAAPVLERPDEDADAEGMAVWASDWIALAASSSFAVQLAIEDADVLPVDGTVPVPIIEDEVVVLEAPPDDSVMIVIAANAADEVIAPSSVPLVHVYGTLDVRTKVAGSLDVTTTALGSLDVRTKVTGTLDSG